MYQDRQYKLFSGNTPFALGIICFHCFRKKKLAIAVVQGEVVNGNVLFLSKFLGCSSPLKLRVHIAHTH